MNKDERTVLELINRINKVHNDKYVLRTGDYAPVVFMYHHCYYFATMLHEFYPDSEYYMRKKGRDHVVTRIGDNLYDSSGIILNVDEYDPFVDQDWAVVEWDMIPSHKDERELLKETFEDLVNEVKEIYYPELLERKGMKK